MENKELEIVKKVWLDIAADYILPMATVAEQEDTLNELLENDCISLDGDEIQFSVGNDYFVFNTDGILICELRADSDCNR